MNTSRRERYWSEHPVPSPTQNGYSPNVSGDQPTELAENPKPKQGPQNCYMEGSGRRQGVGRSQRQRLDGRQHVGRLGHHLSTDEMKKWKVPKPISFVV